MNQAQWQVLQAIGVDCWQRKAPGEQGAAAGIYPEPSGAAEYAIIASAADVTQHRQLLSSIITAVGWLPHDYLLIDDATQLTPAQRQTIVGVWWLAIPPAAQLFPEQCQHTSSVGLNDLATNRAEKGALWQQLKRWRKTP
ncbi:DNA polymerase III subunit psi [Neiella sp. HB171785]|uniref:DNA polymerase III subunit psi n=1 Tax=Neiella litorisoli TaxID=2771431 RepID=A0A8J6QRS3_9GAMM|nr:DNA polymerase III subunit psi [Neiella litorisoli]MBD1390501.1 DNA polymerase III subunit psi [Neiella litorisoli]